MTRFLKENFVLVLGVSLPVLLILIFMLVHGLARMGAAPPQYPVLYVSPENYYSHQNFDFNVKAGALEIYYEAPDTDSPSPRTLERETSVALYDALTDNLQTFEIKAPADYERGERASVEIPPSLQKLTLSESLSAPDGYRFEAARYRSRGFFPEMFGYNSRDRSHRLVKDGISYSLPQSGRYYYGRNTNFIGWVIDGDK